MIMMKNLKILIVLVGVTLVAAPVAPAQVIDENFDSLDVGTNVHDVEGWEGWYGDRSAGGYVTADQAYSGNHSMESMVPFDLVPNWDRITAGTWILTTMQYVPSTATSGSAWYGVLSGYEEFPLQWITEVVSDFVEGDVRITGGDTVRLPLVRDAWVEIKVELDFDSNVSNFYYNGELLGTRGAVGLEGIDLWANTESNAAIYYDDFWLGTTEMYYTQGSDLNPEDGASDVARDVVLSWEPGYYADKHDVYFGTVFDDVNNADRTNPLGVLVSQGQSPTTYDPDGLLDFGQTYYWRIDEVSAPPDLTIDRGLILSFTGEPFVYPVENITVTASSQTENQEPENTVNGSGLDNDRHSNELKAMWITATGDPGAAWIQYEFDKVVKLHEMWVWNHNGMLEPIIGIGFKDVSIEYSVNGTDYTTLGATHEFARASGAADYEHNTTVDFEDVTVKYVRLTTNSNWGGGLLAQYGLSEVRLLYIPVRAREPSQDSGATEVDVDVTLGFRAGREAAKHDVYLSTDEQAVIDGTAPVSTVTGNNYSPSPLDVDTTYYWRVDEVNDAQTPTTRQGDIWNFTTSESLVVDDFELYNDLNPDDPGSNRIFNTWIDGFGTTTNGSTIGYMNSPFVEQSIVYGGKQSMPYFYDNNFKFSEAELTLSPAQDWTEHGVTTLVLYFYGDPSNVAEQMYVKINGSKVLYDGDVADIARPQWKQWTIDLASFGVNLQNVTQLIIGFGDETNIKAGGAGVVYFDNIRLYQSAPAVASEEI